MVGAGRRFGGGVGRAAGTADAGEVSAGEAGDYRGTGAADHPGAPRRALGGTVAGFGDVGMLILALETTADVCSVAIRDEKGLVAERAFRHRMHLSERLI